LIRANRNHKQERWPQWEAYFHRWLMSDGSAQQLADRRMQIHVEHLWLMAQAEFERGVLTDLAPRGEREHFGAGVARFGTIGLGCSSSFQACLKRCGGVKQSLSGH
jgi:hypothetical protein